MVTVTRIKTLLASAIVAELSEDDDTIIDELITKNSAYASAVLGDIGEGILDFVTEQLTLADLYARFGYDDLANSHRRTAESTIMNIGSGKVIKKPTNVLSSSRSQIFTEDEFSKW